MPIDEDHNKTRIAVWAKLHELTKAHPDARIVSCSDGDGTEWKELFSVIHHEKLNTIELVFD